MQRMVEWQTTLVGGMAALALIWAIPVTASARQATAASASSLVFDSVTVVDVEQGKLIPGQRVVIVGNRIQAVGGFSSVPIPEGAQAVQARDKYLIPGLWDLHVHPRYLAHLFYPLFIATGVTGIRDAWSETPLDTLRRWRREIWVGTRVGPPRQILSGPAIDMDPDCRRGAHDGHTCVSSSDTADPRHLVDSLKAAGVDMLKMYGLSRTWYFAVAAAARHVRLPFGGHVSDDGPSAVEVSDSGASIIDHPWVNGGLDTLCSHLRHGATVARCRPVAERFRRNGTWLVPTWSPLRGEYTRDNPYSRQIVEHFNARINRFWMDSDTTDNSRNYLRGDAIPAVPDSARLLSVVQQAALPVAAGTDVGAPRLHAQPPGFTLHEELAMYVAEGLTPLTALQSATLNPAKLLHATDSLGTIAAGKLADLVLLDANPLADITNTTTIRAVIANGRYFDRAALDQLLTEVRIKAKEEP